jgi:hypothetical protein
MHSARTKQFLLILAAFGVMGKPALAQKQTPPAGGPPKAFTVPAHETYSLPNGMQVTLIPYGNVPKVTVSVALRTGNLNEPKGKLGLADLTGDLLKEGTATLTSQALAETTARMGSALNVGVGADQSTVSVDVPATAGVRIGTIEDGSVAKAGGREIAAANDRTGPLPQNSLRRASVRRNTGQRRKY